MTPVQVVQAVHASLHLAEPTDAQWAAALRGRPEAEVRKLEALAASGRSRSGALRSLECMQTGVTRSACGAHALVLLLATNQAIKKGSGCVLRGPATKKTVSGARAWGLRV